MRGVAGAEPEGEPGASKETRQATSTKNRQTTSDERVASVRETLIFTCSICNLKERYDYKGARPPFARQLLYSEDCYVMKDPFSPPNKGEILVVGADCSKCKRAVCSTCSIYYARRFCLECASGELQNLPLQLHGKIRSLAKR
ncbi:cysteine-rich DPF motif domain-containing protein 1 [Ooceraea biroi]|nr:cysteine-rich DPF motif domain-containing protein 1 [Ooceraea biroi]